MSPESHNVLLVKKMFYKSSSIGPEGFLKTVGQECYLGVTNCPKLFLPRVSFYDLEEKNRFLRLRYCVLQTKKSPQQKSTVKGNSHSQKKTKMKHWQLPGLFWPEKSLSWPATAWDLHNIIRAGEATAVANVDP